MKITEKNIGKELMLLRPIGAENKRKAHGIFCIKAVEDGRITGEMRVSISGCIHGQWEPCPWVFDDSGHSIDESGKCEVNGYVLEEV
ncbi:MAG: hypothetical protein GWN00_27805 [Aliifodinibius sp.]|nr:hypothetical protein [candidate division Zixibacteria bacterium]NIT59887.1 hypothetical protein [Fodinibius sp.]NIV14608.1 hypothetical protein [Fodinibius sp.]NIY28470.1 hypothetical protein [Fodinibius sp.]